MDDVETRGLVTVTDDNDDRLFGVEVLDETDARRPITELRRMHNVGVPLLQQIVFPHVYRVRNVEDLDNDPDRIHQVTVRYQTKTGGIADEWLALHNDSKLIYGWLDVEAEAIKAYAVLDGRPLVQAITERPGVLVAPAHPTGKSARRKLIHHAPGGAQFYVVDMRRLPDGVVSQCSFPLDREPAPLGAQEVMSL